MTPKYEDSYYRLKEHKKHFKKIRKVAGRDFEDMIFQHTLSYRARHTNGRVATEEKRVNNINDHD